MLILLTDIECYGPAYLGRRDIVIAGSRIYRILPPGQVQKNDLFETVIDGAGLRAFPGLIDQHVHIIGGGGEEGFASRLPEIHIEEIRAAGVTTLIGLLGADGCTRSLAALYAKAKELEALGITTYIYAGSYAIPPVTFTGSILNDLVLVDKVIGTGEIAISDHRSSHPSLPDMLKLACDVHLGGMLGGKAGVLHLHVGDGRDGLSILFEMMASADLPIDMFVPTHVNRNPLLFLEAMNYRRERGQIDLTAGETAGISVPQAVSRILDAGLDLSGVTVSSDANGSAPGGSPGRIGALYDDLQACILQSGLSPDIVWPLFSENVARVLKLYPQKGVLMEGSDADILVTDRNYNPQMLFCRGRLFS